MYTLLEVPMPTKQMWPWDATLGRFSEVVGYSHLGSVFLRDPEKCEYLVLHPLLPVNNVKHYGAFDSTGDFEAAVLKDPPFVERFLRPPDLAALEGRLGPLRPNQVYFPVPYPCVGGSGALSTFDKGDVWVFLSILGQTLGIG